jgi:hypothetical protein
LAAAFASVAVRFAQMRAAVTAGSAAGVSVTTWLLLASSNFAWAATGVLRSDAFFAWSAAVDGVCSLAVIAPCIAVQRKDQRRQLLATQQVDVPLSASELAEGNNGRTDISSGGM